MYMAAYTTKKAGFFGEFFQAVQGVPGTTPARKALEFHIFKPKAIKPVHSKLIVGKFKTGGFYLFDCVGESWVKLKESLNVTGSFCLFAAARAFYFLIGGNIGKHFRAEEKVFQAMTAYKYGFFGKHTMNLKKVFRTANTRG